MPQSKFGTNYELQIKRINWQQKLNKKSMVINPKWVENKRRSI